MEHPKSLNRIQIRNTNNLKKNDETEEEEKTKIHQIKRIFRETERETMHTLKIISETENQTHEIKLYTHTCPYSNKTTNRINNKVECY